MAVRVSGQVKISGAYTETYFPAHIKSVAGLLNGTKIDRSILPLADATYAGIVKLSKNYTGSATDTALSQEGAKELYNAIIARVSNLESPLDYAISVTASLLNTSFENGNLQLLTNFINSSAFSAGYFAENAPGPGTAMLLNNTAPSSTSFKYYNGVIQIDTSGYWLWIYDGELWTPSIEFPDIPSADYTGATESAMIEGIITKAMLWKLKGIEAGAQVNTVTSVAGKTGAVVLAKADVGLGNVDNTADSAKNVASAAKLTTARTIAGVSFDGTANIAIPFANLSTKPTTLSGYGITDAQAKDADLTAIAGLSATSGTLRKTAANTWTLDDYMELKIYATAPAVASIPEGRIILVQEEII